VAELVDCHSRGIDSSWLIKRAAAGVFKDFGDIKAKKDHSIIHLIALGDAETYGGNRNGDWFYKTARELDLPLSNWDRMLINGQYITKSADTFRDRTEFGNVERAETFVKYGHVFKNHKNRPDKGDKIFGIVKAAAHNPKMDRVELLIEVPHGKDWDSDLEKLANGEDIPWSMAAKVKWDCCSACGHISKKREEYCDHLKNDLTAMLKTGHVVGAINDHMTFFDISRVIRPADRIAWSLVKAASGIQSGADLAAELGLLENVAPSVMAAAMGPRLAKRAELLNKAADLEKHIPVVAKTSLKKGLRPINAVSEPMAKKCAQLRDNSIYSLPDAYRALADAKVCLPLDKWAELTIGESVNTLVLDEAYKFLPSAFSLAIKDLDGVVGNSAYDLSKSYPSNGMRKLAFDLSENYGVDLPHITARAVYNTISGIEPMIKTANKADISNEAKNLLMNYVTYKLAFLESVEKSDPLSINHFIEACVVQNCL
jgi:hypothetical protein